VPLLAVVVIAARNPARARVALASHVAGGKLYWCDDARPAELRRHSSEGAYA
jgi:hypothetical protein